MAETRQFKMHPKLLYDVIRRQAGTLSKAILEGVMNAIDARATNVTVDFDAKSVTITDNGIGFRSKKEIEDFFETFGQPHDESEGKRFGTFRMGRGQMFAFGKNAWETGNFRMAVNIADDGLDYKLTETGEKLTGCKIVISLYEALTLSDQRHLGDELASLVKWLEVPVVVNGKQVSNDPKNGKWDDEDDNAYYKFKESGQLVVYNLGVVAESMYGGRFGCGGEIVSKKQLRLNFARNNVMADCPVWKKIAVRVSKETRSQIDKRGTLSQYQREQIARQLMTGDEDFADHVESALFTDVTGKHYTFDRLMSKLRQCVEKITVAPAGDHRGDRLMQHKLAFVLNEATLQRFRCDTVPAFIKAVMQPMMKAWHTWDNSPFPGKYVEYSKLVERLKTSYEILDETQLTALERAMVRTIECAQNDLIRGMAEPRKWRKICVGKSDHANGWTDGDSYICIARHFLREVGYDLSGMVAIGQLVLHEYCHADPSDNTHVHSPDFYELYHNSRDSVPMFVEHAVRVFAGRLETEGRRVDRKFLRSQDAVAKNAEKGRVMETKNAAAAAV